MTFLRHAGLVALLALAAAALGSDPARAAEGRPIKKIVVNLAFEDAELILKTEAERQNLNLINILDIKKGMENRGGTFRPYKIYQFCNLELGIRIYADAPDYGAFQLCSVLIYEVQPGRTALVSARQTWVLGNLPGHRASAGAVAAAREFEKKIDEIFNALIEEGKAKGK
ncbi:MAG TPA: DUF302 domain-containing protein [Methylomirabilota bacterium]|nr:DUF302 domain-containing protein [Methylomirabilota bacterium]